MKQLKPVVGKFYRCVANSQKVYSRCVNCEHSCYVIDVFGSPLFCGKRFCQFEKRNDVGDSVIL